jgi:hypothetical protein
VHRDPRWLVVASVIAAPSAMYLWRVSITADQIWAMRRLLPLTVPGFLVLATVVLAAVWTRRGTWTKVAAASGALAVAVSPLLVWNHELFTTVELDNRYGEATSICAGLPSQRVAFVGSAHYPPTLTVLCDAEVVWFDPPVTAADLDRTREAWGGGDVSVVTFDATSVPWEDPSQVQPYLVISTTSWAYALSHIPREATVAESRVYLGVIGPEGFVAPIPAGGPALQD